MRITGACFVPAVAAALLVFGAHPAAGRSESRPGLSAPAGSKDGWRSDQLVQPDSLAGTLAAAGEKPLLLHVGFRVLFRSGAIPGSTFAGPGSKPEGIRDLTRAAQRVPRNRAIILYCGCCPWEHCPNVRPAFLAMKRLGFRNVRVLSIPADFQRDWVEKGYPVTSAAK